MLKNLNYTWFTMQFSMTCLITQCWNWIEAILQVWMESKQSWQLILESYLLMDADMHHTTPQFFQYLWKWIRFDYLNRLRCRIWLLCCPKDWYETFDSHGSFDLKGVKIIKRKVVYVYLRVGLHIPQGRPTCTCTSG